MNQAFQIYKRGYTLVELMVAISILALLFVAGVTSYSKATQRSRDATRKSDLEQVRSALEMYRADIGNYATQMCTDVSCSPINVDANDLTELSDYLPSYPLDPDGSTQYQYQPLNVKNVGGGVYKAYGYCLYGNVEQGTGTNLTECIDITGFNYEVKNP